MTTRRRKGIGSLVSGFMEGYDAVGKIVTDNELRGVMEAKPEASTVLSEKNAPEGMTYDADTGQYIKSGGAESVESAGGQLPQFDSKAQTSFLGKTYDKPLTEPEMDKARLMAMSGVMAKHGDPIKAMQLRQQATQAGLMEVQLKGAERQDRREQKADDYEAGKGELFKQSRYFQTTEAQKNYESALAGYNQKLQEAGTDPAKLAALGPAPAKPAAEYSVLDSLHDTALGLAHDIKYGRADMAKFSEFAVKMKAVKDEGFLEALQAAQAGASKEEIAARFNASGKVKIDPNKIVSVTDDKVDLGGGAKTATRIITYLDDQGKQRTINTARELDSLGRAQNLVERAFKGEELATKKISAEADKTRAGAAVTSAGADVARANTAADAEKRAANKDKRDEDKLAAVQKGLADYADAEAKGDTKGMHSARMKILANGGKLDKAEPPKTDVMTHPMGGLVTKQISPDGSVVVTPISMDSKPGAPVRIAAPGAAPLSLQTDPRAIAIRDDNKLSPDQKRAKLKELGYQ